MKSPHQRLQKTSVLQKKKKNRAPTGLRPADVGGHAAETEVHHLPTGRLCGEKSEFVSFSHWISDVRFNYLASATSVGTLKKMLRINKHISYLYGIRKY